MPAGAPRAAPSSACSSCPVCSAARPPGARRVRSSAPMSLLQSFDFAALRELLGKLGADGWLLYDFHGINPAATRVLGINGMGTRRFFVLLPRAGKPVAIAHRIELASFDGFPGE